MAENARMVLDPTGRPLSHPSAAWTAYYWSVAKCFGFYSWRTWRDEMLAGALIGIIAAVLTSPQHLVTWGNIGIGLLATAIGLSVFALWHLIRSPWMVERDKAKGQEVKRHWFYGYFGLLVLAVIAVGGTWGGSILYHNEQLVTAAISQLSTANSQLTAANARLTTENIKLKNVPPEPSDSLRRKTIKLADDIDTFVIHRQAHHPPFGPRDDPKIAQNSNAYDGETEDLCVAKFKDQIMGIAHQLRSRGLDPEYLDASGAGQARCLSQQETKLLRCLAHYLDAEGNVVKF